MAKHTVKGCDYNLTIACPSAQRSSCVVCKNLTNDRCRLADFIHSRLGGKLPELRFDNDRQRFFSFYEMIETPQGGQPTPSIGDFSGCLLCGFQSRTATDLQRHLQLLHPGQPITALHPLPFRCTFRKDRPIGPNGAFGPYEYCDDAFATYAALDEHKGLTGHKKKKKPGAHPPSIFIPSHQISEKEPAPAAAAAQAADVLFPPPEPAPVVGVVAQPQQPPPAPAFAPPLLQARRREEEVLEQGIEAEPRRRKRVTAPLAQVFAEELNAVKEGLLGTRLPFKTAMMNTRLLLLEGFIRSADVTAPWRRKLTSVTNSAQLLVLLDSVEEELPMLIEGDRFR